MTVWYKTGVAGDLNTPAQKGLGKVASLYASKGKDLFVTSIRDGNHMDGSFHYIGMAFDFRKAASVTKVMAQEALGSDFDVIEHDSHFHVEYDPK